MLTRRNFFVILIMFLVVFLMFMLVDISAGYLTRHQYNPQADVPVTIHAGHAYTHEMLNMAATITDLPQGAVDNPWVAIIAADEHSVNVLNMREWCMYNRFRYQVFTQLPEPAQLADCHVILFDDPIADAAQLPTLQAYALQGNDMIFTRLPTYQELQAAPELADFYGIQGFVQEQLPINGLYIFDEFFVGGERIYGLKDIYGDTDADIPATVPWYDLRAGYLMFIQAVAQDGSIDYMDLPGLLWRTYTGNANVFVVNTDIFQGKNLPGLLTACMAQMRAYYVYPVVNAQTISVVDFPMLAQENAETMAALYSRGAEALGRDVLWPGIVKILKNYNSAFNFFMAPQLDYADGTQPTGTLLSFYRQEIEQQSGMLGLSMQQHSTATLETICAENAAFLEKEMPEYRFTAACVTGEQLAQLAGKEELPAPLGSATLLMTDMAENQPLMRFINGRTLAVSFTTDGFIHESMDDLRLLCIENALGMNNQKVEMGKAFYPAAGEDWNTLNLLWSRGDTFQKPYHGFDNVTVYGLEEKARTFLSVDYEYGMENGVFCLDVTNGVKNASFVLRLADYAIQKVEGGSCKQLSDTAYLLQPEEGSMFLTLKPIHALDNLPQTYQEVIDQ